MTSCISSLRLFRSLSPPSQAVPFSLRLTVNRSCALVAGVCFHIPGTLMLKHHSFTSQCLKNNWLRNRYLALSVCFPKSEEVLSFFSEASSRSSPQSLTFSLMLSRWFYLSQGVQCSLWLLNPAVSLAPYAPLFDFSFSSSPPSPPAPEKKTDQVLSSCLTC